MRSSLFRLATLVWLCGILLPVRPLPAAEVESLTIPRLTGSMRIDGMLNEPLWEQAAQIDTYHAWEPKETDAVSERTVARIFFDDKNLYVGVKCYMKDPSRVRARMAPREDINSDDQIGIYLDTYNDDRQMFVFYLNALGIQQDARYIDGQSWNQAWDTVLESRGKLDSDGYTVEVAIPFRSLRFPKSEKQTWGLILTRKLAADGAKVIWPRATHEKASLAAQAADLKGMDGMVSGRNLELQPTLVTQWGNAANESEAQLVAPWSYKTDSGISLAPGISARYGITSNLTLDGMLNPDFSQIEADGSRLDFNSLYALYLAEGRPFFLEGSENFGAPQQYLHTRSVVSPLWGLKLTGQVGANTLGLLTAWDESPSPSITRSIHADTPGFRSEDIFREDGSRRASMVNVARLSRELKKNVSLSATYGDKEIIDEEDGQVYGTNHYGALDFDALLADRHRTGLKVAVSGTGDGHGDDMAGATVQGSYEYSTRKLGGGLWTGYVDPKYRAENAFITRAGFAYAETYGSYRFEPAIKHLVYIRPQLYGYYNHDTVTGLPQEWLATATLDTRFLGQTYLNVQGARAEEWLEGQRLPTGTVRVNLNSDNLKRFTWSAKYIEGSGVFYSDLTIGHFWQTSMTLTARPASWILAQFSGSRQTFIHDNDLSISYLADTLADRPTSSVRYIQSSARATLDLTFDHSWSLRAITDLGTLRTDAPSAFLFSSLLLRHTPHPGTALFLGASRGQDCAGLADDPTAGCRPGEQWDDPSWRVFLKLSYLWRV